jgi:hypothetical protein
MTSRPRSLSFQGRFMFGTFASPALALPLHPERALIATITPHSAACTP